MDAYQNLRQETWKERFSRKVIKTIPVIWGWLVIRLLSFIQRTVRFILSLIPEAFGRS
ncbi:MAG: hypothetical protein UT58_C0016G0011 [Microgenomates group bacterium GW2011_GWC1_39_7b]|nr:MAG: hypothetical protein UT58_C0016G0011 [Microgenomates group bacterium GW2011_GWC1_39_7b]